jgi:hypothetical protein
VRPGWASLTLPTWQTDQKNQSTSFYPLLSWREHYTTGDTHLFLFILSLPLKVKEEKKKKKNWHGQKTTR